MRSSVHSEIGKDEVDGNRELIRRHHEKHNTGDWRGAVEDFAIDSRNFGRPAGRDLYLSALEDVYRTFPDWKMEIIDLTGEGENVVVRCQVSGTHRGIGRLPMNGGMLVGVEPTGKRFEVAHIHWYKLKNGRIVDHYATRDDIGMMAQLGLLKRETFSR